jgi:outer membrane receptor protein involved in Fe transport
MNQKQNYMKFDLLQRKLTLGLLLALILFAMPAAGQGNPVTLTGAAFDASSGDAVPQVQVEITGPVNLKEVTDLDGRFTVKVPPGKYNVKYTSPNHLPSIIEGVEVTEGSEIVDASAVLAKAGEATQVEVTATVAPEIATAEALLTERKLADTVQDSISGIEIKQSTASDAAGALTKVTGVSVVGEGFVYVRGLGERYSATTLNNALLATTEPERRVVPLDLFPANLIDNIKVLKTYAADLPGEFSAGLVQVETVEFPTRPTLSIGYSLGLNSQTQFDPYMRYPGGERDKFGFDDGTRAFPDFLPENQRVDRFTFSPQELQEFGRRLPNNWERQFNDSARPIQNFNLVTGKTFGKFGFIAAVTFSNGITNIFDQTRNFYSANADVAAGLIGPDDAPPVLENSFVYDESKEAVRLGGVVNLSYQVNPAHKLVWRNFLSRDTDNETRFYTGFHRDFNTDLQDQRLRWVERSIASTQVEGEHLFTGMANSIFLWQLSVSAAERDEPDLRENVYLRNSISGEFEYFNDAQSSFRMYNDLNETIFNPNVNWMVPFYTSGWTGSIKFGANASMRDRSFLSRRLRLTQRGSARLDLTLPPNQLFAPENIRPNGFELSETTRITDAYDGKRNIYGYYAMLDLAFAQRWRLITGLRVEDMDQDVTTFDPFNPNRGRQPSVFKKTDLLPAANVVYSLTPRQNLRFGYSQTVARPDFRELALFDFLDIVGGRQTVGNPELEQTTIHNYDLRWELFPGSNQLLAVSFFYKTFDKPIERTVLATVGLLTTFENADSARNFGFELEFRRNLEFISPKLNEFAISSNFTLIDSTIDLTNVQNTVLTTRERALQGQSRYVANAIIEWARPRWRSTTRLYANYFSSRITDVGSFGLPDVIQQGVPSLEFVYELSLRENGRWRMRFSGENLNNPRWRWLQGGEIFQSYRLGRTFEVGTSFDVF